MSSEIQAGFSTHKDRFEDQWNRVWALDPDDRESLLKYVRRFRSAGGRAEQDGVIADLMVEVGASRNDVVSALGVLDYVGHLHARSQTSVHQTISELRDLGFLPEEQSEEAQKFLERLLAGIPDRAEKRESASE